jgi:hypothetical protein
VTVCLPSSLQFLATKDIQIRHEDECNFLQTKDIQMCTRMFGRAHTFDLLDFCNTTLTMKLLVRFCLLLLHIITEDKRGQEICNSAAH